MRIALWLCLPDGEANSGRGGAMLRLDTKLEATSSVDCAADPIGSLVEMFVAMVQAGRIAKGQCPALRPVFLKPHGVARGVFRVRPDLAEDLKVGLFAGAEYPAWVRFSSDTLPDCQRLQDDARHRHQAVRRAGAERSSGRPRIRPST